MAHNYVPTPVALTTVPCPDDGDAPVAASVNGAFEELGDGVAYLNQVAIPRIDRLTAATGTWTVPAGVTEIEIQAFAGGGGGGGGGAGDNISPTTRSALGGGGGAGSKMAIRRMTVTPGAALTYVNGAGGSAGVGGTSPSGAGGVGGDGADSTFNAVIVARGGGGGYASSAPHTTTVSQYPRVSGGRSPRGASAPYALNEILTVSYGGGPILVDAYCGGQGGAGDIGVGQFASAGGCSSEGFAGGAAGTPGATVTNLGGGGGGGGGAGPGGAGGAGGPGGSGAVVTGVSGHLGTQGAANTGAGGGGGGAGGQGGTTGGNGEQGRVGGRGAMAIVYFGTQAVFT